MTQKLYEQYLVGNVNEKEDLIDPNASYVVIDSKTKKVVYKTTYKNRNRARRWGDKKDIEYGGYRYITKLEHK